MKLRPLGNTGLEISELGFGCAALGNVYGDVDEAEATAAVHAAIDHGIIFFDVAPFYGLTLAETRLGKALRGRRDRVMLATKCCRDGKDEFDFSADHVTDSVEASLQRLQTDHVDLLQIHDVEFGRQSQILEETLPAVRELQAAGKTRFVGITGLPVRYLRKLAEQTELDTILSWGHYNLVEDELDEELAPLCETRQIGLMNAAPLLQGLLTRVGAPSWHRSPVEVLAAGPKLAAACHRFGLDLASVALQHAICYPRVATTIVSMHNREQVEQNVAAIALEVPRLLRDELASLVRPIKNRMWFEGRPENNIRPLDPTRWVPQLPDI